MDGKDKKGMKEMEYRRYQGKSYMVWHAQKQAFGYETPMLTQNSIPGFLPAGVFCSDDKLQFWYDISGRQALEDWIKIKKAGSGFLRKFITALAEAIVAAGEFLLYEDGISLNPGHIFVDMQEREFTFCYLPFDKTPFPKALQGFMEYYLSHMEHSDREGAQKCYDVYEKCRQDQVDLEELLSVLYRNEGTADGQTQARQKKDTGNMTPDAKPKVAVSGHGNRPREKGSAGKWPHLKQFFLKKGLAGRNIRREGEDILDSVYRLEGYDRESPNQTVFLGSETGQTLGELKFEGGGQGENFPITADTFLIGSQQGEVDGMIPDETVSRIHARITKEEDQYYLEDMNSTNGTYCNGELLNYRERVKLEKNDRIAFAQVCYRFV